MIALTLGVVLWWAAHLFKRLAPQTRARMGDKGKGPVTLILLVAIGAMIFGYKTAEPTYLYSLPPWSLHLNNTLMLIAVILMGAGQSRGRVRSWFSHPMLLGVATWATAHLLVNGDVPSLVLFGGLGIWALVEMRVINRADGPPARPEPGPLSGDIRLLLISLVVFAAFTFIHQLVGPWPFPS